MVWFTSDRDVVCVKSSVMETQSTDLWLPRGRGLGEGWSGRLRLADAN